MVVPFFLILSAASGLKRNEKKRQLKMNAPDLLRHKANVLLLLLLFTVLSLSLSLFCFLSRVNVSYGLEEKAGATLCVHTFRFCAYSAS